MVTSDRNAYLAVADSTGAPLTDTTKWMLLVENASDYLADTYSASATYAVGDFVTHGGKLYECNTAIETAEEWTAAHWTETTFADAMKDFEHDIVLIQAAQPTSEDNRFWIPTEVQDEYQVPTYAEFEEATDDIADLKSAFDSMIDVTKSANTCDPDKLEVGLLNSGGIVDASYTTRKTTDFIAVDGLYVSAYCHQTGYNDIGPVRIAFYNSDKSLKTIVTTSPAIVQAVDGAAFVRASFATGWDYYFVGFSDQAEKVSFEEYYPEIAIVKESALPGRITSTDNWLYKFAECDFVGGNVHLSIDDVGAALYYLANNNPASLWDSDFFSQLKTLHDTYGVCITCNCFSYLSTLQDYDIATVPNTWASDFVGAKSWLKFAFHAKNNTIDYSSAETLKTDYEYFVSAIYHMTGDYDCIDTGTRLSMFTGSKIQIEQAMTTVHGITMLWTADDDRDSYYFDSSQTARVNNRGKYIDDITNLLFVKSMPRLDNHTIDDISPLIAEKPQYGKMVEIFCHENLEGTIASGTITRVNNALAWFNTNGYESHFLTDIFI